jgi:hypothetical protein
VRDILDAGPGRAPGADDDEPFALEGPLGGLVAALRAPADLGPGVDAAVMAAVRLAPPLAVVPGGAASAPRLHARPASRPAERAHPLARGVRWLSRPRAVRISPLGALAAAGIAIAAMFGLRRDAARRGDLLATGEHPVAATGEHVVPAAATPAAARGRDTVFVTRFVFVAPDAKQVALVGDFNDWKQNATPLVRVAQGGRGGVWTVELPLAAGRYSYAFLIDGHRWTPDPAAPRAVGDDFGRPSSVVTVRGA